MNVQYLLLAFEGCFEIFYSSSVGQLNAISVAIVIICGQRKNIDSYGMISLYLINVSLPCSVFNKSNEQI